MTVQGGAATAGEQAMEWRDQGVLLAARPHGEGSMIIEVLTEAHGRHSGVVRGGQSSRLGATMQPGSQLTLEWRARLEDHIGSYKIEPLKMRASMLMEDRHALAGFNALSSLVVAFVPEREADFDLYEATLEMIEALCSRPRGWQGLYVMWETVFLSTLGFGLDLSRCAATGVRHDLAYLSPRTGRAVCRESGGPYAARLLDLPPFMVGEGVVTMAGVRTGLRTVGWFLENRVCPAMEREHLPEARQRFLDGLRDVELASR
ncbi:MAG: DNA repair protein RecO, partial [Pseudomonadota bacterium]